MQTPCRRKNEIQFDFSSFTCNLNRNKQKRFRFSEWHQRGRKDHDIQAGIGKASFHCGAADYRHGNLFLLAGHAYSCNSDLECSTQLYKFLFSFLSMLLLLYHCSTASG